MRTNRGVGGCRRNDEHRNQDGDQSEAEQLYQHGDGLSLFQVATTATTPARLHRLRG